MARTGRRPGGGSGTQEAILDAARAAFSEAGYDGATIRGIAGKAAVDPALVHHYYGTKEQLFVAAMELPFDPSAVLPALLEPGLDGIGERIVRLMVTLWDSAGDYNPFAALLRSAMTQEKAATMFREFATRAIFANVVKAIDADRPELRTGLVASQMAGLIMTRYLLKLPAMVQATPDELVAGIGPTLQRYLTDPLDLPSG
ncbi:TetR family transcriptional regulator [Cryptosporangium arvum]|jgi:AcrR family transcriptional regulator|uniref:TetR/AcrR family transcriptional regulator n=1 Tax=Cryptosporangium arvum TaxID=80871 RepID=UPI0004B6C784|nr:TetR family transcriptional regulator [Cryptosporangium arvum]